MSNLGGIAEWVNIAEDKNDNTIAIFQDIPVENKAKSRREGRPIYDTVTHVEIRVPGQPKSVIVRPVQEGDKSRWANQWAAFKNNEEARHDGMPLSEWPRMTVSRVKELNHVGIYTVEQLAKCADAAQKSVGPDFFQLRQAAQDLVKGDDAEVQRLRQENATMKRDLTALQARMDAFIAEQTQEATPEVDAAPVEASQEPPKRGRPRKKSA